MTESIFSHQNILEITNETINDLKRRAQLSPRKRFRLCMHHSTIHETQEMLIVFHKDTFMPPHRHPKGKSESYHLIEGTMTVCFFDDDGQVTRTIEMEQYGGAKTFLYRLSDNEWHTPIATSEWLVYHETYTGPFIKDIDVEFPHWAPQEEDKDMVNKFLAGMWNDIKGKVVDTNKS